MENNTRFNGHTDKPLSDVLNELRVAADRPFEAARPIPAAVNHSSEFYGHEQKTVFMKEWICIGRTDEIVSPGDYITHEIASVPVLIVRQKDDSICGFVNACAHRFACLAADETGSAKRFMCRYHAWTYDLDGRLIRAPYMEMKEGFDLADHGLRALQIEVWEGFIYVTLAEHPVTTVAAALEPFRTKVVGRYDMARYKTVMRETMVWGANWKNLIENFTESYHVPMAHPKTFALHKKPLEHYICGEDSDHYGYHRAPQEADVGNGAAHPNNTHLDGEWRRMMVDFCVFPSNLVTLMPDFLWWISVQPQEVNQFQATWGVAIPPEVLADIQADEYDDWLEALRTYMNVANDEDKVLVEALNKGSASTLLPQGVLHPIERNLWQFTRYLARVCGAAKS
ncbi:aromatic ring-hydroxylating dioxygenase subunit alpha [Roseovarius sp. EL26]|uniref:aromatic ring-hydroxylating oxygenase subunit alpha n=1 Tax=Roseovarius sp. EL26 TaxID=2126672 RepID=UPI000EA18B61|nr:SRPBCC family protein [Roseovarius sp. EL26]